MLHQFCNEILASLKVSLIKTSHFYIRRYWFCYVSLFRFAIADTAYRAVIHEYRDECIMIR